MRTRIALTTAMAVTFTITSFDMLPAPAQTVAGAVTVTDQHHAGGKGSDELTSLTTVTTGSPQPTATSLDYLLWPTMIGITLMTPAIAPASPSTPGSSPVAPAPAPVATPPPPPPPTDTTSTATTDWQCIRVHESGDEYNDPARPSGAYGILESTWLSYGYSGWPYEATASVQDALALELYHEYGWHPWSTSSVCGLD